MGDLPPEIRQQILRQQADEDEGRQELASAGEPDAIPAARPALIPTPGRPRTEIPATVPAPKTMAEKPAAAGGRQAATPGAKPKRNALKRHKKSAAVPEEELVSMNVRLTREAYDAVADLADEYGVSKAMVIRLALSGNMGNHLGTIRYTDPETEAELRRTAARIGDASVEIGHQLRRIGKNYNDALKLAHIEAKRGGKAVAPELDTDLVKSLIERHEAAAERMDEAIWRILK